MLEEERMLFVGCKLSPWWSSDNYLITWLYGLLASTWGLDFGECKGLTPFPVPSFWADLHISSHGSVVWAHPRAGSRFSQDGLCPVPSDLVLQGGRKRSLPSPKGTTSLGSGDQGSGKHSPSPLSCWSCSPSGTFWILFSPKHLFVSSLKAWLWVLSFWWGEILPLCVQIYWRFLQSQWKTGN